MKRVICAVAFFALLCSTLVRAWGAPPLTGVEMMGTTSGNGIVLRFVLAQSSNGQFFSGVTNLTQLAGIPIFAERVVFHQDNNAQLQVIVSNFNSQVRHAIRDANGNWTAWGDVLGVVGSIPGTTTDIAMCPSQGVMNVFILSNNGRLYYARRSDSDGTWTRWEDVRSVVGDRGFVLRVACAASSAGLQVGIVTSDGGLWHAIRNASSGLWSPFGNVISVAGGGISGITNVGMTVDPSGDMQIMVSTNQRALWHSIRSHITGSWTHWGYVFQQTGSFDVSSALGPEEISGTLGNFGEVEWVVDWAGQPYWTTRRLDGTWTQFQNLKALGLGADFSSFHVGFYASPL